MAITHERVVVPGNKGTAEDWNADHVVDDDSKPKNFTTLIVAPSNALDTTRADYVCDGIDDQDTINEAIGDLPATGGRISILDGTCDLTGSILIDKDNTSIEGLGAATIIQTADNVPLIIWTLKDNIAIKSLTLKGNNAGALQQGIKMINTNDSTVEECWIEDVGDDCISMTAAVGIVIDRCWFIDPEGQGVQYGAACNDVIIRNNIFKQCRQGGVYAFDSTRLLCIGNTIYDSDGIGVGHGINLVDMTNSVIANNIITDCNQNGITLDNADNITITGNVSQGNGVDGVDINATSDDNIVIGNQLINNAGVGLDDNGVGTDAAHNKV